MVSVGFPDVSSTVEINDHITAQFYPVQNLAAKLKCSNLGVVWMNDRV